MPALILLNSSIFPSKASLRDLSKRKDLAQAIRLIRRPSFLEELVVRYVVESSFNV